MCIQKNIGQNLKCTHTFWHWLQLTLFSIVGYKSLWAAYLLANSCRFKLVRYCHIKENKLYLCLTLSLMCLPTFISYNLIIRFHCFYPKLMKSQCVIHNGMAHAKLIGFPPAGLEFYLISSLAAIFIFCYHNKILLRAEQGVRQWIKGKSNTKKILLQIWLSSLKTSH